MSSSYPPSPTFQTVLRTFASSPDLPPSVGLTEAHIPATCDERGVDLANEPHHIWAPALTLGTFLTPCLSDSRSCAAAAARALVLRVRLGLEPCSEGTAAHCKARAELPVALVSRLTLQLGEDLERQASKDWQWKGRRVLLGDGTTTSGPDTPENQATCPQHKNQKRGLGFPLIRMVVLLGLATGALVGAALGPWSGKEAGEMALLRELLDRFRRGDVFVADRAYCSYWLMAAVQARGVDVVIRLHQSRHYHFSTGRRLGSDDHVVTWTRPARPDWMDKPTYHATPKTLTIRETRFGVERPGHRTQQIVVATTRVDATAYTHEEIAELYHYRWRVELSTRDIKQTLAMDVPRGKAPEMLRREIWCHLLAYNLIRQVIAQAAGVRKRSPRHISVTGAKQTPDAFRATRAVDEGKSWGRKAAAMLRAIGGRRVGMRPDRCEPREVKRRPQVYPRMTRPRATRRAALMAQGEKSHRDVKPVG